LRESKEDGRHNKEWIERGTWQTRKKKKDENGGDILDSARVGERKGAVKKERGGRDKNEERQGRRLTFDCWGESKKTPA